MWAFCKMLFTYGRGRAEQFRLHPTPGSALNFVPPLFCLYLVLAAAFVGFVGPIVLAPLGAYLLIVLLQTVASIGSKGLLHGVLAMPLVIASHIFYGLGFWRGLFTKLKAHGEKPATDVQLDSMPV